MDRLVGDAASLHGRDPWAQGEERAVALCRVTGPALVLGSGQPGTDVDRSRARDSGVQVARRRSGGGAVLVVPGQVVWADVAVPAGDPLWEADVGRASWWLGQVWAEALASLGLGTPVVHRGAPVGTSWSRTICFAGLGPGEVTVGGGKVVGLCQRRTRSGAVFHCAALVRLDAAALVGVLALDADDRRRASAALEAGATGLEELGPPPPPSVEAVESALVAHLP